MTNHVSKFDSIAVLGLLKRLNSLGFGKGPHKSLDLVIWCSWLFLWVTQIIGGINGLYLTSNRSGPSKHDYWFAQLLIVKPIKPKGNANKR